MSTRRLCLALVPLALFALALGDEPQTALPYKIEPPDILTIEVSSAMKKELVTGAHLVRPDGTVSFGVFGSVDVEGLSLKEAEAAIEKHLAKSLKDERDIHVRLTVHEMFSRPSYLVTSIDGKEQTTWIARTEHQTVASAILQIEGVAAEATRKKVWLARASGKVLEVDWRAITQEGRLATNYRIEPGDRVYVGKSPRDFPPELIYDSDQSSRGRKTKLPAPQPPTREGK